MNESKKKERINEKVKEAATTKEITQIEIIKKRNTKSEEGEMIEMGRETEIRRGVWRHTKRGGVGGWVGCGEIEQSKREGYCFLGGNSEPTPSVHFSAMECGMGVDQLTARLAELSTKALLFGEEEAGLRCYYDKPKYVLVSIDTLKLRSVLS